MTRALKLPSPLLGAAAVLLIFASATIPAPIRAQAPAHKKRTRTPASNAPKPAASSATAKRLEELSRALKKKSPASAYEKLSAFANENSSNIYGTRAALALGYYDYSKTNFGLAAKWLVRAQSDTLLRDYALYWSAETNIALSKQADALTQLKQLRSDYPDSVMTDQALESLAGAAIALNQPLEALAALDAYPATDKKPALLLIARRGA